MLCMAAVQHHLPLWNPLQLLCTMRYLDKVQIVTIAAFTLVVPFVVSEPYDVVVVNILSVVAAATTLVPFGPLLQKH